MLENNTIKFIKSLQQKKFRNQHNKFIVEGVKLVNELITSNIKIDAIYATDDSDLNQIANTIKISEKELSRISGLKTPNKLLAIAEIPSNDYESTIIKTKLSLVLENLQDPGNMGTIIRIANWYGIEHIFCSYDTVDCYNPKVVQATMGGLFRVNVIYSDIYKLIQDSSVWQGFKTYATQLNGGNIYDTKLSNQGFIIMGNESKGISSRIKNKFITQIKLPSYPLEASNMESLNVAVATALTVSEFRRRIS